MEAVDHVYVSGDSVQTTSLANEIAGYLVSAYLGYSWSVDIRGGMLFIKSNRIHPVWGMAVKLKDLQQDAGVRKKVVIMKAGEFLEAANMRRGQWQGGFATDLEGRQDQKEFSPIIAPGFN